MNRLIATTALTLILGGPALAQAMQGKDVILSPAGQGNAEAEATAQPETGGEGPAEGAMTEPEQEAAAGATNEPEQQAAEGAAGQPQEATAEDPTDQPAAAAAEGDAPSSQPATAGAGAPAAGETAGTEVEEVETEDAAEAPATEDAAGTEATEGEALPAEDVEAVEIEEPGAGGAVESETAETEEVEPEVGTTGAAETMAATDIDAAWRSEREALVAPRVEREGFTAAPANEFSVDTLVGTEVYDTNDESVGNISDVVMDDTGAAQFAVVEVGGFLGLGAKPVAIGFDEMQILRGEGDELRAYVDVTEEMVEGLPEYEAAEN